MTDLAATGALPKPKRDLLPVLLPAILALSMLPLIGSGSSWVTLTVASFAMGMMIFIMASGLTLVFGLMDVLNFGHGAFIAVGAYVATLVLLPLGAYVQADSLLTNLAVLAPAAVLSMAVSGALGLVVERVLILPVYGQHLKQILMTTGGLIVAEQALYALWGPQIIPLPLPTSLRGSFIIGDIAIAKYRLLAMLVGLTVLVFIVVIIGGLGSIGGCFIGALLVAMVANYGGFLVPKLALVSNILLMVAILMWRPRGLYAVTSR